MMYRAGATHAALLAVLLTSPALAQSAAEFAPNLRRFIAVAEPVVALENVAVVDGTGGPLREAQTIVFSGGRIQSVGPTATTLPPPGARVLDLAGHTVLPGIVGLHNHTWYLVGERTAQLNLSAPRLYLASGVTTARTTGSLSPYAELNLQSLIEQGREVGPRLHITGPYIIGRGPDPILDQIGMRQQPSPEAARRAVRYWAAEGATWIKAYTQIPRDMLGAVIQEAHGQGLKVTGHLCSVTYREAVELGIDNIEHGLLMATDFHPDKRPDACPAGAGAGGSIAQVGRSVDLDSHEVQQTIRLLVDRGVALTSTLAVLELFVPGRPTRSARVLQMMAPDVREAYLELRDQVDAQPAESEWADFLRKTQAFEYQFVQAGGLLAAGADPTGMGGALPGFADQRNYELLIEAGFAPLQAVQILTANGAKVLGEYDRIGSIEAGKAADLVVIRGDPTATPAHIRSVTLVFRDGVGYDSAKLIDSVRGLVGRR